jgi:hypothetical protein
VAVIEWFPTARLEVETDALPPLKVAVPSEVPPSKNCTVPVAAEGETAAVKVTDCPNVEGLTLEARLVVEVALLTVSDTVPEALVL